MNPNPRPAFDPRTDLRVVLHDLGPITVHRPDATGTLTPREERRRAMTVLLDGVERIEQGLVIAGADPLVALSACSCGFFECNLTEGYAARVRRFGAYVLWVTPWAEHYCFGLDRYQDVFGPGAEGLPGPRPDDCYELDEPAPSGQFRCPDGRTTGFDADAAPDGPLARLRAWRGEPGVEAVAPPQDAIELQSLVEGAPSLWLDASPRAGGRRAAFLPGVFILPVWITSPEVDQVVQAALG